MTESTTDAAELLGTDYEPGEDAMFGEQLFQPGIEQTYGVGLNDEYVIAIGDRVAVRMWGPRTEFLSGSNGRCESGAFFLSRELI